MRCRWISDFYRDTWVSITRPTMAMVSNGFAPNNTVYLIDPAESLVVVLIGFQTGAKRYTDRYVSRSELAVEKQRGPVYVRYTEDWSGPLKAKRKWFHSNQSVESQTSQTSPEQIYNKLFVRVYISPQPGSFRRMRYCLSLTDHYVRITGPNVLQKTPSSCSCGPIISVVSRRIRKDSRR